MPWYFDMSLLYPSMSFSQNFKSKILLEPKKQKIKRKKTLKVVFWLWCFWCVFFVIFVCVVFAAFRSPKILVFGSPKILPHWWWKWDFFCRKKVECGWGELMVEKVGAVLGMAMVEGMGDERWLWVRWWDWLVSCSGWICQARGVGVQKGMGLVFGPFGPMWNGLRIWVLWC